MLAINVSVPNLMVARLCAFSTSAIPIHVRGFKPTCSELTNFRLATQAAWSWVTSIRRQDALRNGDIW